jgi:hypothetical protein
MCREIQQNTDGTKAADGTPGSIAILLEGCQTKNTRE